MVTAKKIIYISTGDDLGNNDFFSEEYFLHLTYHHTINVLYLIF